MDSIRSFLASWVAVIKTRIEIIAVEIEEQREWLQVITLLAVAALFCISLGIILLTLFVVVLVWDTPARMWVLGGFALIYLIVGIALALLLKSKLKSKPRIFSTTSAELEKDFSALQPDL
jgi:uncharacterized membrane protein YqjE